MGTSAGASSGRRTPPGVTPEESSLPQGFMPTTTRRGLHSAAGIFRAVRGALVALFFLRVRARGLVFSSLGEEWLCGRRAGAVSALLRHASCVAACLL